MTEGYADTTPGHHLEVVAAQVASAAAALVRTARARDVLATGAKSSPTDVVTETDVASETFIRRELTQRCPGSTIVGEELGTLDGANGIGWIVDPIDGTVNFLYGLPIVSVSIAATVAGTTVAGAVADVVGERVYSAALGGGARCDGRDISVSACSDISQGLIGTGFSYAAQRRAQQSQILNRMLPACRDIRCMGSAALNLCWVGAGHLDGYYEHDTKVYDYAAGAFIAAEAGATVITPEPGDEPLSIASTPDIFERLSALVDA